MLKVLILVCILASTSASMKTRFHRSPRPPPLGVIADSVLSVMPAVMVVTVVSLTTACVFALCNRKMRGDGEPTGHAHTLATFQQLEEQVASLLAAQTTFRRDLEGSAGMDAAKTVRKLSELEEELQQKRLHAGEAFAAQVQRHCSEVDTCLGQIAAAVEGGDRKQRNAEVEELLAEWKRWKQIRGQRTPEVSSSYMDHLKEKPDKTYYPQDLSMSLPMKKLTSGTV